MGDYSVTKPKGPYPTDLPEVKVGPNEETIVTYGEDAIVSLDIVGRLNENIIADAFERRAIVDGALCERLIRERKEAADKIERLRAENDKLREALNWFLNGAVPLGGLTHYEYEFVVEARKRAAAAALKETGDE